MELTPQQIKNWRRVMASNPLIGPAAFILPDRIVIKYAAKIKELIESDPNIGRVTPAEQPKRKPKIKKCPPHNNTIRGQRREYCIDCETYL